LAELRPASLAGSFNRQWSEGFLDGFFEVRVSDVFFKKAKFHAGFGLLAVHFKQVGQSKFGPVFRWQAI